MNIKTNFAIGLAAAVTLFASVSANASGIAGLYSTGQGISADATADSHYSWAKTGGENVGNSGIGYTAIGNGTVANPAGTVFPNKFWVDGSGSATSHWLTPSELKAQSYDYTSDGQWTWTTTFDLTGYMKSSAGFTGRFAADNSAIAYLNGHQIGATPTDSTAYSTWTSLTDPSGFFKSGLNTLTFVVMNNQNKGGTNRSPTGLRVEFLSSTATAFATPIPAAVWLFGSAFAGLMATAKRKKA